MVGVRPSAAALLTAGTVVLGTLSLPQPATAATATDTEAAVAAARWQAGELVDGGIPFFGTSTDWGLTADTLIALEATGAEPDKAGQVLASLKAHVRDYNSNDAWGPKGQRIAGATAKLLYAAVAAGADPSAFGAYDLRQETLDLVAGPSAGPEEGRVKDRVDAPATDSSNTFAQSWALLGLSRSGEAPQSAVDFLIDQQCASGGFRLYPYAFGGTEVTGDCDAQGADAVLDPDSTAIAVQALLVAAEDGADGAQQAAGLGAEWLLGKQAADGSFGGSGPTEASNTNSTGLAGQALAATGHQEEADRAADWLREHQLTAATAGKAAADAGAIAYDDVALAAAKSDGIEEFQRDQWRRATPQALLGLAQVPLGEIGLTDPDPGPEPSPDPTSSGEPSPDPSGTPGPSDNPEPPAGSGTPTPTAAPSGGTGTEPGNTPGPQGGSQPSGGSGGTTPDRDGSLATTGSGPLLWWGAAGALVLAAGGCVLYRVSRRAKGEQA